jgi:hypothetical protein
VVEHHDDYDDDDVVVAAVVVVQVRMMSVIIMVVIAAFRPAAGSPGRKGRGLLRPAPPLCFVCEISPDRRSH